MLNFEQHCKPGYVIDGHLSCLSVAGQLLRSVSGPERNLPESTTGRRMALCLVLLRVGFAQHFPLPENRWSLTPPFHPYRPWTAVSFLLHFPGSHLHRTLSGTLPFEARTFLFKAKLKATIRAARKNKSVFKPGTHFRLQIPLLSNCVVFLRWIFRGNTLRTSEAYSLPDTPAHPRLFQTEAAQHTV